MLIVEKKKSRFTYFEDLRVGDCFLDEDCKVLIKVSDAIETHNSFDFTDNCLRTYLPEYSVKKINCKLVEI